MPVISGRENYFCHTCKNSREITPEWKCAVCNSSFVERRESVSTPQPLPQQPVPPQPAPPRPVSQPITRPPSDFSIASIHQPSAGITDISQIHQAPLNFYNESSLRTSVPVRQVIRQPQRRPEQVPVRQQYYRRRTRLGPRVRQSRSFTRGRPSLLVDEDGNLIQSSNNDGFQLEEEESSSLFNIWQRINPGRNQLMNVNPNDIAWTQDGLNNILDRLREESERVNMTASRRPGRNLSHLVETQVLPQDNTSCCICMSDFEEGETFIALPCKHVFHADEIRNWLQLNTQCPVCRKDAV